MRSKKDRNKCVIGVDPHWDWNWTYVSPEQADPIESLPFVEGASYRSPAQRALGVEKDPFPKGARRPVVVDIEPWMDEEDFHLGSIFVIVAAMLVFVLTMSLSRPW